MKEPHRDLGGDLSGRVIGAAISVHRALGPGLEEADYQTALQLELEALGLPFESQVPLPLHYKGITLDCGYRIDLVVEGYLLLELKAVERWHPVFEAQTLTYLCLSGIDLGLLINFNVLLLRDGIKRLAYSANRTDLNKRVSVSGDFEDALTREVLGAALEVQHHLGRGLLKGAYEVAMVHELSLRGVSVSRGRSGEIAYRGRPITTRREIPLVVEERILVACFCVEQLEPIHLARQQSLLRAARAESGLCLNFHSHSMDTEVERILAPT